MKPNHKSELLCRENIKATVAIKKQSKTILVLYIFHEVQNFLPTTVTRLVIQFNY